MNSLYSVAQIREIEQLALAHLPTGTLMQRAGAASARLALEIVSGPHGLCKVLVLAGPGNNGGDALDASARLAQAGMQVSCVLFENGSTPSADAKLALLRARASSVHFIDPASIHDPTSSITSTRWHLVVDGLFGIGLKRPPTDLLLHLITTVNHFHCPVLALDVPSGLDADTGNVVGAHGAAIRASHTITFIGDKPGLHTAEGRDYAGQVHVSRLEIDGKFFKPSHTHLSRPELFMRYAKPRPHQSHKGSFGSVAVLGGADGMQGAAILAARTALLAGAGRVFAAFPGAAPGYDPLQPEIMCRKAGEFDFVQKTEVIGPGLGNSREVCELLAAALQRDNPAVLDADALNLIALEPQLQQFLRARKAPTVLTPHPLEAARLLGHADAAAVQRDRLQAGRELAARYACTVIVKGSGTVVANAHGHVVINPTGNAALASGGSGDVLAGLCGALLAQHWPEWESALAACWIHGSAAEQLSNRIGGTCGLSASELLPEIRLELNRLVQVQGSRR